MDEVRKQKNAPEAIPEERLNPPKPQQSGAAQARRIREEALDKTIEDTFPSSDPPSSIPDPGEGEEAA